MFSEKPFSAKFVQNKENFGLIDTIKPAEQNQAAHDVGQSLIRTGFLGFKKTFYFFFHKPLFLKGC